MHYHSSRVKNYKLFLYDIVDSTMNVARELAKENPHHNIAIISKHQTAGKGRFNRIWESGKENLYLSLVIPPKNYNIESMNHIYQMSFVFSLSILETIQNIIKIQSITHTDIKCKWPNDVLIRDKKISGILTSVSTSLCDAQYQEIHYLCIGIGVNIQSSISTLQSTSLREIGINITPLEFFHILIDYIEKNLELFKNNGFPTIRDIWKQNAYKFNENIKVKILDNIVEGTFIDIDEDGSILLEDTKNSKKIKIHMGDIM